MATANTSAASNPRAVSLWRRPLLVGLCFGLGYGLTQRLLDLRLPAFVQWGQSFDVRPAPGTSLDSLRQRFGDEQQSLRGQFDLLELKPIKPDPQDAAAELPMVEPPLSEPSETPEAPAAPTLPAPVAPSQP